MIQIHNIRDRNDQFEAAVKYFVQQWGSEMNANFYRDCMELSCITDSLLPRFYIALDGDAIVGSCALLRSDMNSRQDLEPWFACLYVAPEFRGRKLGTELQNHAIKQAKQAGYNQLYLCTDLDTYYENNDWVFIGYGYSFNGDRTRIYKHE
ncbi:GNAT family N-acetyltransferase [Paenibacillus solisilvae]|uniref:GNAT family N-acetyltransferase n=1 Tax=Paenibacillus solisilvae TaxID=2486751 RepID=A0ABW0W8Q9_9BACL